MPHDPQPAWVLTARRTIGNRIREARIDADLTQERLAEQAGVSWKHIHRIEHGTTAASIDTLLLISAAVRVPLEDLVKTRASGSDDSAQTTSPAPYRTFDQHGMT